MDKLQELSDFLSGQLDKLSEVERELELNSTLFELKIERDENT